MVTLQISDVTARKLYPSAANELKEILEMSFPKNFFKQKVTDRIKTFEDALNEVGASDNLKILLSYNGVDSDMLAAKNFARLTIITRALNGGWTPDFSNTDQPKWQIWWQKDVGSCFGLSYNSASHYYQSTNVPSRLCFKSRELAQYAAAQFLEEFAELYAL